jgi:serine/threonine protein kinase
MIKPTDDFYKHYRLLKFIGQGSNSEVYLCESKLTDEQRAVKTMRMEHLKPDDRKKYIREA